jgi:dihydrofolate reductase
VRVLLRLAQTLVRLGLVDQYHFVVHPIVSPGASWFDQIEEQRGMTLASATRLLERCRRPLLQPPGDVIRGRARREVCDRGDG